MLVFSNWNKIPLNVVPWLFSMSKMHISEQLVQEAFETRHSLRCICVQYQWIENVGWSQDLYSLWG